MKQIISPAPERHAYTIPEVCQMLDVSPNFFYDEVKRGNVRYIKVGRSSRVLHADFEAWVQSFEVVGATPKQ